MKRFYFLLTIMVFLTAPPLSAQDCNDLEILTTTNGSVCGAGSVTLSATASGTGDGIYWFDAATGGTFLGAGPTYQTPPISTTTSYWATEVIDSGGGFSSGWGLPAPISGATFGSAANYGLLFDVHQPFTLASVDVYTGSATGDNIEITIFDENNNVLHVVNDVVPPGNGTVPYQVDINYSFIPGNNYRLSRTSSGGSYKFENSNATTIGYPLLVDNVATIKRGAYGTNIPPAGGDHLYYIFYNWTIGKIDIVCESPREEVIATVNNQADEEILTLPYTHTASTFDYDNNYSGAPGTDCGTTDSYLDGYDVVYKYTADDDYILNIELSGLTDSHTAVFIYESCMDIGNTCYAEGSVNENIGTHSFQVSVEDTKDYYIVVSSASPTDFMDYTLTVTGTTCANYPAPTGPAAQSFIDTQTLADLDVTGADIAWYSDAALTNSIPESTVLVNNTTYYATQSFQGCESAALAVTVTEVQCSALEIVSSVDGAVCGEGSAILEAQGATPSVGTEIHWFDAPSGGNLLGKGNTFRTPTINTTTSFWASEVAMSGGELPGQAKTAPTLTTTTSLANYGLQFDVFTPFTLVSVEVYPTTGGLMDLELRDATGTVLNSITGINVPNGDGVTPVTLTLNMDIPAGNGLRLLKTSSGSPTMIRESTGNTYPYLIGSLGEITGGALNQGNPLAAYYWFYNWTVTEAVSLCESPREEVIATVNDVADELVTEPLPFAHTANTSAYGNNYEGEPGGDCNDGTAYIDGNETVYQYSPSVGGVYSIELSGLTSNNAAVFVYESCYDIGTNCWAGAVSDGTNGNILIDEVPMYDGFDYFIVVTTATSASTDYTLTVDLANINCSDYTAAPGGDADQFFEAGDTLDDLVVYGGNLTWYSDAAGTSVIPNTTLLVNGTTYYVKQTLNGCDSDLLGITVHEIDCSALAIVSTTDGNIVCKGVAQLEAVGNGGPGTEIYWYDAATGGNFVGMGNTFTTPELTSTTSYWATEIFIDGSSGGAQTPELIHYKFDSGNSIVNDAQNPVGNNPASITGSGLSVGGTGLSGTALQGNGVSSPSGVINTGWNTDLSGSFTIGFWTSDITPSSTLWYIFGDSGATSFRCFTNGAAGANNWMVRGGGLPDLNITGAA